MKFETDKSNIIRILNTTNKISKINKFEVIYICHSQDMEYIGMIGGSNKGIISSRIIGDYEKEYEEDLSIYAIRGNIFNTAIANAPEGNIKISFIDNGKKLKITSGKYRSTIRIDTGMKTNWVKQMLDLLLQHQITDDIYEDQLVEFSINKQNINEMCATAKINFGMNSTANEYLSFVLIDNKLSIINKAPNYIVKNNIDIFDNKSQENIINIQLDTVKYYFDAIRFNDDSLFYVMIKNKYEYIETSDKSLQCLIARASKIPIPSVALLKAFKTLSHKLVSMTIDKNHFVKILQTANSMSTNSSAIITLNSIISKDEAIISLNHSTAIGAVEDEIPMRASVYDNNGVDITSMLEKTTVELKGLNAPRLNDSIRYLEKLDDTAKDDELYGTIRLDVFLGFKMQQEGNPINFIQLGFDRSNILYSVNLKVDRLVEEDSEPLSLPDIKYFDKLISGE